jgi:hypothetical protein
MRVHLPLTTVGSGGGSGGSSVEGGDVGVGGADAWGLVWSQPIGGPYGMRL